MSETLISAEDVFVEDKKVYPSRKPRNPRTPAEYRHIEQVGEIVYAWNQVHGMLFHIFTVVVFDADIWMARAIWHSHGSDKAQRTMLEAAVEVEFEDGRKLFKNGILWATKSLQEISVYRNDLAHAEIIAGHAEIIPALSVKPARASRINQQPLEKEWMRVRGDLYAILNYLEAVYLSLWQDRPRPLVYRPKLQSAHRSSKTVQGKRRRAKAAAQQRQRQSSQATH